MDLVRYRYDIRGAYEAGEKAHPQQVIRAVAPEAVDFEAVTIGDCWWFRAPRIAELPSYIREID